MRADAIQAYILGRSFGSGRVHADSWRTGRLRILSLSQRRIDCLIVPGDPRHDERNRTLRSGHVQRYNLAHRWRVRALRMEPSLARSCRRP